MKQTQVLIIHGGMTFRNKRDYLNYLKTKKVSIERRVNWAGDYLEKKLGPKFKVIRPRMPKSEDAKYAEWKIFFERYLRLLKGRYILIGNSLGGIFLAKYLSENRLTRKALAVYMVCAPFDDTVKSEDLVGGFRLGSKLSRLEYNASCVRMLFSYDDKVVPVSHAKKYAAKLKKTDIHIYKGMNGHFDVPTFPEIIKLIKKDVKIYGQNIKKLGNRLP